MRAVYVNSSVPPWYFANTNTLSKVCKQQAGYLNKDICQIQGLSFIWKQNSFTKLLFDVTENLFL